MDEKSVSGVVSGQQQFNLRWNNHTTNILQVFMEQYATENLVDVTIACDGQFIKAHKMVLSACSPYFQEIFRVHTVTHPMIIVNGMKHSDLKQIIEFMYRGEVKVLETELDSLLAVAESLQVKGLSSVRSCNKEESTDSSEKINNENSDNNNTENLLPRAAKRKKLKTEEPNLKSDISDDESLASSIKIEPPEIRDIDQDDGLHLDVAEEQIDVMKASDEDEVLLKYKTKFKPRPIRKSPGYIPILPKHYPNQQQSLLKSNNGNGNGNTNTNTNTNASIKISKVSKVPRPPNAFMIFANEWRRKLAAEYPKESNKEISVRLGIMWKNLTTDAKDNYYSASRKADEEHKRKYPGYYYSPKEARLRKNLKNLETARQRREIEAMHIAKLLAIPDEVLARRSSTEKDEIDEEIDVEDDNAVNTSDEIMDVETIKENNLPTLK